MSHTSPSLNFIQNPFIKRNNLKWTVETPKEVIPKDLYADTQNFSSVAATAAPSAAAVEAGQAQVQDHLSHFTSLLSNLQGCHFVIHQHDHPLAGTHYDLRLQINPTSSASWAIMYGLPGDPNSIRLNRNATETRIHCLWNHLIETASSSTGSLLIYDTGTYTVLPHTDKSNPGSAARQSFHSQSPSTSPYLSSHPRTDTLPQKTQQELLHEAFQNRKIRLRLHGSKLPDPYVINLRLTKKEDVSGHVKNTHRLRVKRKRKRRRVGGMRVAESPETTPDEEGENDHSDGHRQRVEERDDINDDDDVGITATKPIEAATTATKTEEEAEREQEQIRSTNAYPGAENTIGSVHQRRWYLSLDREACSFVRTGRGAIQKPSWHFVSPGDNHQLPEDVEKSADDAAGTGEEEEAKRNQQEKEENKTSGKGRARIATCTLKWPFYVRGVEHETSVVTGRKAADILRDEGVVGFVSRRGWSAVLK